MGSGKKPVSTKHKRPEPLGNKKQAGFLFGCKGWGMNAMKVCVCVCVQGFCYVYYASADAAAAAMDHLNGAEFPPSSGHRLKVSLICPCTMTTHLLWSWVCLLACVP